jgi:hypothetical protein
MSKKFDVVYAVPAQKEGDKPRWLNVGAVFETQKGLRLKLDSIPVGFNGWLALFDPKPKEQKPAQRPADNGFDDEIGF